MVYTGGYQGFGQFPEILNKETRMNPINLNTLHDVNGGMWNPTHQQQFNTMCDNMNDMGYGDLADQMGC